MAEQSRDSWQPSPIAVQRKAFRRRRARRSAALAIISTVVVLAGLAVLLVNAPGWPRLRSTFFDVGYGWQVLPEIAAGLWLNLRLMVVCEIADPDPGAGCGADQIAARAGVLPAACGSNRLRGHLPRAAADPGVAAARVRHAQPATGLDSIVGAVLGMRFPDAGVRRLRGRGAAGRDQLRPSLAARCGQVTGPVARQDHALCRCAAGVPAGITGPDERSGVAAEGHRPDLDPGRRLRRRAGGQDQHRTDASTTPPMWSPACCSSSSPCR